MLIELNSKINDKSKREKKIADIDWNQSLSAIQSNWKMSKKNYVCVCVQCMSIQRKLHDQFGAWAPIQAIH